MTNKHRATLADIQRKPTPSNIRWQDLIGALKHYGVEIEERSGSRLRLKKGKERIVIHRPHHGPATGRATIRDVAAFLRTAGISRDGQDDG